MKHKMALIGFSYLFGLVCAVFLNSHLIFIIGGFLSLAFIITLIIKKKSAAVVLGSCFAAFIICGSYTFLVYEPLVLKDRANARIGGVICEIKEYSKDRASYIIETEIDGIKTSVVMFDDYYNCGVGDKIYFSGKLSVMYDNIVFAEKSFYRSRGIFLKATSVSDVEILHSDIGLRSVISDFSDNIGEKIMSVLTGDDGALIKAVFMGDKSSLSDELKQDIKRAGMSHFTAVSGLHMSIIAHISMIILSFTFIGKQRYLKFFSLSAVIILFMIFFKLSVSVMRAGIMLIIYYGSDLFMRRGSTLNSMGAAAFCITLFNPYACLDPGLWLSLAGTFGIGVVAPNITRKFMKNRFYEVKSAIIGSVCAAISVFPLSCLFFGGFSFIGIIVSLLIYPLFFPILVCMFAFVTSFGFLEIFLTPCGIFSSLMSGIIRFFGSFEYSYIDVRYRVMLLIFVICVIFVVLIYFIMRKKYQTLICVIISVSVMAGAYKLIHITDGGSAALILYSDGTDACVIMEKNESALICASGDSNEITQYINNYVNNGFVPKPSVISLLRSNHNNLSEFENFSCERLIISEEYGEQSCETEEFSLICGEGYALVKVNGVYISISPSRKIYDSDINIIYGKGTEFSELHGITFTAASTKALASPDIKSFYFEDSEYIITASRQIERINPI